MNIPNPDSSLTKKLAATSLFKGLQHSELEVVVQSGRRQKIVEGSYLFYQGDPAELTCVLIEGKLRLIQVTPEGQQVILRYVSPFEEFAVISVLSEIEYPASAESVENSVVMTWKKQTMQLLMQQYPGIAMNAIQVLAERIKEFQDRLREMATEKVERRIARTLLRLARQTGREVKEGVLIDLPLSRQDLAEMTGTTLYTVSRTLSNWESQGIIQSGRERVVVRKPHSLVVIAEDLPAQPLHPQN
jgi:CRP/FNR family transcriptional regulator, nitrogen oxide reductase regulator